MTLGQISPEEYDIKANELFEKNSKGIELNAEEKLFFCSCTKFENLLDYTFCTDEYYKKVFLARRGKVPAALSYFKDLDKPHYQNLVNEWEEIINKKNHSDQLLSINAQETRQELKNFSKNYSFFKDNNSFEGYSSERSKIIEWSKYKYIFIKNIFDIDIKSPEIKLILNKQQISFTYYSLTHILTRHFAKVMKPYFSEKSHFSKDIIHKEIHQKLKEIFEEIEQSGLYVNDSIEEVNIKYNDITYKIFCALENKHEKGKQIKYYRLNSFFPVDNRQMLSRLENEFKIQSVNERLSVFVKI